MPANSRWDLIRRLRVKWQNGTYASKCIQTSYYAAVRSVMYLAVHIYSMFRTQTSERCSHPYDVAHISSFPQNGWKMLYHCRRPEHPHLHSQAENKVANKWICSNIYPTGCNVTQFILSRNRSTCSGWYLHPSSGAQTTVSSASYRGRFGTLPR